MGRGIYGGKGRGNPHRAGRQKSGRGRELYETFIGSDFIEEGKNAAIEMSNLLGGEGKIVELEGTVGASAANDRKKGFDDEIAANHTGIEIWNPRPATLQEPRARKLWNPS